MAETCQFQRFDLEGHVTYRCEETGVTLRFMGHGNPEILLCDDHYFWPPDPKYFKGT